MARISHPPDGNPLIGPAPGVENYWCCCGTQIGIGWGPGLTRELARWMVHGAADISMREYDPRRFGAYADKDWQVTKATEDYCLRHEIPFPHLNRLAGRPIDPDPLYWKLREKGAVHEEVYGHERPRWFAKDGVAQRDHYSFRRNAVHDMVGAEVRAVRTAVGIMDISAFAKVEVAGPGAAVFLDRLIANRLPARSGGIVLTHLLNERGRIELETTVVKLSEDDYYLVCAVFFEQRLIDHLTRHGPASSIVIRNRSRDWAALALNGPRAREVLKQCTGQALDNESFRWLTAKAMDVAGRPAWALRMSYAGELGWELHLPRADALDVYLALLAAGEAHGITDYGSFAMNAMRMEKAFKGAGELTNEVTLPEADVMRFVNLDKNFVGRKQTVTSAAGDRPWVCAYLEIDPDGEVDGHGGEAVLKNGQVVGSTSSVAYGHTVDRILAFAYVKPQAAEPGTELDVVIHGKPRAGRVRSEPAYDPRNTRPRTGV